MTIPTWRIISLFLFILLAILGILFTLQENTYGPDKNFWPISIALCLSLANLIASLLTSTSWRMKKIVISILLGFVTLGCLVGAFIIGNVSTMFGGSIEGQTDWLYYSWFLVPLVLWASFILYAALRKHN